LIKHYKYYVVVFITCTRIASLIVEIRQSGGVAVDDDLKIKHDIETIYEDDEVVVYRVSYIILGEHFEHWFTEEKE
jgi:hypothetical protein